jgi:hypothetical protein
MTAVAGVLIEGRNMPEPVAKVFNFAFRCIIRFIAWGALFFVSETNVRLSETNSEASETNFRLSETNSGARETNPRSSETNYGSSETNSGASETNFEASETKVKRILVPVKRK